MGVKVHSCWYGSVYLLIYSTLCYLLLLLLYEVSIIFFQYYFKHFNKLSTSLWLSCLMLYKQFINSFYLRVQKKRLHYQYKKKDRRADNNKYETFCNSLSLVVASALTNSLSNICWTWHHCLLWQPSRTTLEVYKNCAVTWVSICVSTTNTICTTRPRIARCRRSFETYSRGSVTWRCTRTTRGYSVTQDPVGTHMRARP